MNIAINGLGRIGKQFLIAALESKKKHNFFINNPSDIDSMVYALTHDSVHPSLKNVKAQGETLIIKGKKIPVFHELDPEKLPWKKHKIDVVVECSGRFTHKEDASKHLKAGAKKVLVSAPGKELDITIVYGVNNGKIKGKKLVSAGSCTTNALTPALKIIDEAFGIENAHFVTTHAYTATQNLIDGHNRKSYVRGRAAAYNIVPSSSGASISVVEALPHLDGKLDGYALRVPVVDGSFATIVAKVKKKASSKKLNELFLKNSKGKLKGVLDYEKELLVSTDIINNKNSCIIDSNFTKVQGDLVSVGCWYDNEFGYSHRLVDVVELMK
jgi:glyceraldehyde 3-phosphate dehydrogenase